MRFRSGILACAVAVTVVGCGVHKLQPSSRTPTCSAQRAHQVEFKSLARTRMPTSGVTLVGGSRRDGWLFRHPFGFLDYVGPGCATWFPVTVGAVSEGIEKVSHNGRFFYFTATRDGNGPGDVVPPYRVTLSPRTGLETAQYTALPVQDAADFVMPTWPGQPVVVVSSVSLTYLSSGFNLTLVTKPYERTSLDMYGIGQNSQVGLQNYQVVIQDAQLPIKVSVRAQSEKDVTLREGLPPYATSVNTVEWWGAGATSQLAKARLNSEEHTYTLTLHGMSGKWTVTSLVTAGQIVLEFRKD